MGSLLTVRAVAGRLGISTATLYKLCDRGDMARVRIGNAIRIEPAEVKALKARNRVGQEGERKIRCTTEAS
jgi:excisionase family DNA binding protein